MKCVDDFRLRFGKRELVPIMIGGMGVDISTAELALEAARLGGIGHISDAMIKTVSDRRFDTKFVSAKQKRYKSNVANVDKSTVQFDLGDVAEATRLHVGRTMEAKRGEGLIFINCMEKLTMNAPKETLRVRLASALDAGIDGITLAAGLHLGSFALMEDHPRFRDARLGIIVSSLRALQLFLRKSARTGRLPDYVVVEGPLAGGHLGFGLEDWMKHDLRVITSDILDYLRQEKLDIPVIPAGGIFTGTDAVSYLESGSAAVQVATRFTVAEECGLPAKVQQEYFKASEADIEVNGISPTGYPMRMLKNSPAIGAGIRPNCEAYGYLLDTNGHCAYIDAYYREVALHPGAKKLEVWDKTCLCTHMRNFDCWTCGHYTYRLKDTSRKLEDGSYQLLSAEHIFRDYQFSKDGKVALPD
ncbi:MAG: nitronate monooxygenase [Rhodocyclaceae bacterium]|nr:nitronate monooxygenase [Rhodocyclaceae bacterium]MBZ0131165.1 nitronate monooxygenase [Rhodocyclaceae bacterium]MCO5095971.1 nitronate monooxygenase [Rhodocyclaceae bacterium]MCZ7654763.1 nitronate monooxygenase [Rhodocyclaceae bacterium]